MLESLFNKAAALRTVTLLIETPTQAFPMKFVKFLRTPIVKNICEWLLLIFRNLSQNTKFKVQNERVRIRR